MNPFLTRNALILLALSLLAVGLIAVRGKLFHRRVRPMLCNLLLAWVPMVLVMVLDVIVVDTPYRVTRRWRSPTSPGADTVRTLPPNSSTHHRARPPARPEAEIPSGTTSSRPSLTCAACARCVSLA